MNIPRTFCLWTFLTVYVFPSTSNLQQTNMLSYLLSARQALIVYRAQYDFVMSMSQLSYVSTLVAFFERKEIQWLQKDATKNH